MNKCVSTTWLKEKFTVPNMLKFTVAKTERVINFYENFVCSSALTALLHLQCTWAEAMDFGTRTEPPSLQALVVCHEPCFKVVDSNVFKRI